MVVEEEEKGDVSSLSDLQHDLSVDPLPSDFQLLGLSSEEQLTVMKVGQELRGPPSISGSLVVTQDMKFLVFGCSSQLIIDSDQDDLHLLSSHGQLRTKEHLSDLIQLLNEVSQMSAKV